MLTLAPKWRRLALSAAALVSLGACEEPAPRAVNDSVFVVEKGHIQALYDSTGRLLRVVTDSDGDGRANAIVFYGPHAEPLRSEEDSDGDGVVDRRGEFEAGRLVREERDTDGDGQADRWLYYQDGRLDHEDIDTDGDGRPDRRIRRGPDGSVAGVEAITGDAAAAPRPPAERR